MKIPTSLRHLADDLEAACGMKPAWILLNPTSPAHQKFWQPGALELVRVTRSDVVSAAIPGVPTGGQGATNRADWVRKIAAELPGGGVCHGEIFILPIIEKSEVTALIGWSWLGSTATSGRLFPCLPGVRTQVRRAMALEKTRAEVEALRWLLGCSDRRCGVALPDGELLGVSLPARDFLQKLRFGQRHFFRTDDPKLPAPLARCIGKTEAGQVVLNENCTARFEALAMGDEYWTPVVGIEFFLESSSQSTLPLSRLTAVERDIYELITTVGATNREIAQCRGTAYGTVKNQVSGLLQKLGTPRRIHLLSRPGAPQIFRAKSATEGGVSIAVSR